MKKSIQTFFDRITLIGKRFAKHDREIDRLKAEVEVLSTALLNLHSANNKVINWSKKKHLEGFCRISSRLDFGRLLNVAGLTGEGAEVGVRHGDFSAEILSNWKGQRLYSIDPWLHWEDPAYDVKIDPANVDQNLQESIYREACEKLSKFNERSSIVRKTSEAASVEFSDNQLDFVYIDAQHHYEAVRQDIDLWWPKVKYGGIIAGDDYSDGWPGVIQAVDEFSAKIGEATVFLGRNNWIIFKEK